MVDGEKIWTGKTAWTGCIVRERIERMTVWERNANLTALPMRLGLHEILDSFPPSHLNRNPPIRQRA